MDNQNPIYHIPELADKWSRGTITAEEKAYYEKWYASFNDAELTAVSTSAEDAERLSASIYIRLKNKMGQHFPEPVRKLPFYRKYSVAAAIAVLAVGAALYFGFYQYKKDLSKEALALHNKIVPGKNTATLILSDGKTISLQESKTGVVIDAGQLSYNDGSRVQPNDKTSSVGSEKLTMQTPRGGQYQLLLPDGTKVWLNAASKLIFPSTFAGRADRSVELQGEAYFEVARAEVSIAGKKQRQPFIVNAGDQRIEVLGTHFNVNGYDDEPSVKTTLEEGRISVRSGDEQRVIMPGQQAESAGNRVRVSDVNVNDALAWKNGNFQFSDENILNVMRQISRWYNVDVVYQGAVTKEAFGGTISRSKPIREVLSSLEEIGVVHFKIEGRRVIVMP